MAEEPDQDDQDQDASKDQDSEGHAKVRLDRSDDAHDFVDRSKLDFDPDDGLYSGTAVDGTSEIPGTGGNPEEGEPDAQGESGAPDKDG